MIRKNHGFPGKIRHIQAEKSLCLGILRQFQAKSGSFKYLPVTLAFSGRVRASSHDPP